MCHALYFNLYNCRTELDPELGNKFAAHLMQGLSPFNLVYVCKFCTQFFDPDMPDGVKYPERVKVALLFRSDREK